VDARDEGGHDGWMANTDEGVVGKLRISLIPLLSAVVAVD
jgi:hypothetical protein